MPPPDATNPLLAFELLARARVSFVIIGGHAVNFHGYVRTTEDGYALHRPGVFGHLRLYSTLFGHAGPRGSCRLRRSGRTALCFLALAAQTQGSGGSPQRLGRSRTLGAVLIR